MLSQLYALAQREKLCDDPDFVIKRVDVRVRIDAQGSFLAAEQVSNKKNVVTSTTPRIPGRSGTALRPGCVFDKASWVLGAGPKAEAPRRAAAFREYVDRVARVSGSSGPTRAV